MDDDFHMILERRAGAPQEEAQVGVGFAMITSEDPDPALSAEKGYPVFVDREFIKIVVPGDRQSVYCQPATDLDRAKYPRAYAIFKEKDKAASQGFPIEKWPQVTRSMAMTLKAMHIHTVEEMAEVSEGNLGNLGHDGRELRAKAQAFLQVASDTAAAQKIEAEKLELQNTLEAQAKQIQELSKRLEEMSGDDVTTRRRRSA